MYKDFCQHYKEIIEGSFKGELIAYSEISELKKSCEEIIDPILKGDPEIQDDEKNAADVTYLLLDGFLKAVLLLTPETPQDEPEYILYKWISPNYRKVACEKGQVVPTDIYKKFLLVTDYIFGMTDRFLIKLNPEKDADIKSLIESVNHKIYG